MLTGSCKKNNAKENTDTTISIIGSWELRQTSAAMNPAITNYPAGNGNILKFTTSAYETYSNGQLVKAGNYLIIKDTTVAENICLEFPAGQYTNRIVYDNNYNNTKIFVQISKNQLTFISGCYAYDAGHTSQYERQ